MIAINWKWKKKHLESEKKLKNLEYQLEKARLSIEKIIQGKFELNEEQSSGGIHGLIWELAKQLQSFSEQEKQRSWITEGLGKFVDILRKDQSKKEELYQHILSSLVRYLKANQGGIFILTNNGVEPILELVACYAYERKKILEKTVRIGEGLLGQCFLEEQTTMYTDIPPFYTTITSGMGEATPGCLLLVPLKFNDNVMGVLEIASFQKFQQYEIDFVEKLSESIASVCYNIQNGEKAKALLMESEQREQVLKEQEEELRQNLEELIATQEATERKQKEIDQNNTMMKLIVDNIPFPIFVKDELGRYTLINKAETSLFNLDEKQILGKDDSHFVENEEEWKVIQESDLKTLDSNEPVELPVQSFTAVTGVTHIFKTTKIPFINTLTGKKNILGVSVDLTEKLELEKKLLKEKLISRNNMLIDLAGRQRMLSQKIGFYAEMVVRGKIEHIGTLENAIALHDHSLNVLKNGGMPKGLENAQKMEKANELLLPKIEKVEEIWGKYKKAAENIIELKTKVESSQQETELRKWIQLVEEKGELLLEANDELLKAFYQKNRKVMVDVS
ncbi:MAG TPA: GAF domain-containing protein [Cytophagaceae bacterium]|jgi:PAS domain S-box-containing protein|nr:GAF domain-containing protein [Cytophagaceae bacterium]